MDKPKRVKTAVVIVPLKCPNGHVLRVFYAREHLQGKTEHKSVYKCQECGATVSLSLNKEAIESFLRKLKIAEKAIRDGTVGVAG